MSSNRPYPSSTQLPTSLRVRDLLAQKGGVLRCISPEQTVYSAVALMAEAGVGALLVTRNDQLVGIISERDYARQIILKGRKSQETLVEDIMTRQVTTVSQENSLRDCMQLLTTHQFRHLPVVDGTRAVGMVTIGDVVRAIIEQQSWTIDELSRYVSGEPSSKLAVT